MALSAPLVKAAVAQLDFVVGDISGNAKRVIESCTRAASDGAQLLITPELALCGYAAEDLLLRPSFIAACDASLLKLQQASVNFPELTIAVGHPSLEIVEGQSQLMNCASVLANGRLLARYAKRKLPNYQVFDERRYFAEGNAPCVVNIGGVSCGLLICEDAWFDEPALETKAAGAKLLIVLNASPYHQGKSHEREAVMRRLCCHTQLPLLYAHLVGGQDEYVFDGYSFALNSSGELCALAAGWSKELYCIDIEKRADGTVSPRGSIASRLSPEAELWNALIVGVRDYVHKANFPGVLIGLSGGIDSALVLAIAVDALGADKVQAVMMPSPYTADISWIDAADMANRLGVRYHEMSITSLFDEFNKRLSQLFSGREPDTTEENLQARIRGTLLMALSNKWGSLVLTTGNKSEMATGYCTLYGDMAGGFAVIKDLLKTQVYALASWRNANNPFGARGCGLSVIPERILTRPPSAELRPDQTDQDSLPPYEILDEIISGLMEHNESILELVAKGHDQAVVKRIAHLIQVNEYKRRQAPVGIRLSMRSFGKDWRYPICNRFNESLEIMS